ncbi:MAG TPA: FkbM family methyltransferase [Lacipirellulaceae bacterium]|nr:FkbM family methyltransferase [Lacipirellulaceae bacterium]
MNDAAFLPGRVVRRVLRQVGAHRMLLRWRVLESARSGEPELRLLPCLVDPRRAAIDIGAAEGVYAFHLQRLARRCIAFEPNPSSYSELKRALPQVELHQAAVSAVDGCATLRVPVVGGVPYRGWGTIAAKNELAELQTHSVQEIKVRTMCPDRMELGEIGFIKIDVEGHEIDVLAGLAGVLARCLPNLLIEIGGAGRGGSLAQVRQRLDPLGYTALMLDASGKLVALPNEVDFKGSINVIFVAMSKPARNTNPNRLG